MVNDAETPLPQPIPGRSSVKHNQTNPNFRFEQDPEAFDKFAPKEFLQYALGGTLYMPGTRAVTEKILGRCLPGLTSMVMCFEDAIREEDVATAEDNVLSHLDTLADAIDEGGIGHGDIPLTFIRVRTFEQFASFSRRLTRRQAEVLSGFVFPKFYSHNASDYLHLLHELNRELNATLYAMPILEGRTIALKESRLHELSLIRALLKPFEHLVLNVRIGGTDFSSIFAVRRGINLSIYDILPVRDTITDIINFFGRDSEPYTLSAPVWEYFLAYKSEDLARLLETDIHRSLLGSNVIINEAIDGLLRELLLDKANGFVGKTIIHPSHLPFVNAMQAVTREEHDDAVQILGTSGGVVKSAQSNKMNEASPHRNWARKVVTRARAYGVVENERSYLKLMVNCR